jgi:hypothetical protein
MKRVATSMTAQVPTVSADASQTSIQPMGQVERSLLTVSSRYQGYVTLTRKGPSIQGNDP